MPSPSSFECFIGRYLFQFAMKKLQKHMPRIDQKIKNSGFDVEYRNFALL